MPDNLIPAWKKIHEEATIVDVHAHPSLKASLFNRMLTRRFRVTRSWNPFSVRTDFNKLKKGKVDVLWSTVYAPEKELLKECRWVKLMRFIMPCKYRKIFRRPYLEVTHDMLDQMEKQVENSKDKDTGKLMAKMAYSVRELDEILAMDEKDRPIAVIHNIEGAHSLDRKLDKCTTLL